MAVIEYVCPITGEQKRVRFQTGEAPQLHYSASATREEIDAYEKKHRDAPYKRHPHQQAM